jgi:hypothetical protein
MLAFVQNSDTLWGFQMAWYLVMMSLAVALFLLDRPTITWIALIGALVAGVVGSYSSMEGLLIWPTGLALLYLRTRPKTMLLTWFAIAVVTTIVYFHRFNFALDGSKSSYALHHPTAALEFFFFAIGNVLGVQAGTGIDVGYLMGFMLSLVALYVVVAYGVRRSDANGSPLGVALVWFGLLFAGLITLGRSSYGLALGSRYAPFDDLILVGCYLALFEKPTFRLRTRTPDRSASIVYLDGPVTRLLGLPTRHDPGRRWDQTFLFASRGVLVLAIGLLAVVGTANGLAKANRWRGTELQAADVTVNIKDASDSLVSKAVASGASEEVSSIKELTPFARSERLSLFNTPLVARDTLRGSYSVIQRPLDGTILSGTVVLAATTGASSNLTVRFFASGGALHQASIATGLHTTVGWVAYWNTKSVANGKYELRSSLQYAGRQEPLGLPVSVIIRN